MARPAAARRRVPGRAVQESDGARAIAVLVLA
jgi:hypothetical protein